MKIRRKFCSLHGWVPHFSDTAFSGKPVKFCYRCSGVSGLSRSAKIRAFFRGFKLPDSVRAKTFLGNRF